MWHKATIFNQVRSLHNHHIHRTVLSIHVQSK
jgi:hypothetical protein